MSTPITASRFKEAFQQAFAQLHQQGKCPQNWNNKPAVTSFYKETLLPIIAESLELEMLEKELLRIDYVLCKRGQEDYAVPQVFIESENDSVSDLPREIHKLLCVNAPLKVLLTRGSFLKDHEAVNTYWHYPIKDFKELNSYQGEFIVMSAVMKNDSLQYECYQYSAAAEKQEQVGIINIEQ